MSRERELFTELRKARKELKDAWAGEKEARAVRRIKQGVIEDILAEIDSGKARDNGQHRPLIDAINQAKVDGKHQAERAEGAAADSPGAALEKNLREQAGGAPPDDFEPSRYVEWTSADLERVLKSAVWPRDEVWEEFLETGCDDLKILEVLRSIWPSSATFYPEPKPGITFQGGPNLKMWVGARRQKDQMPTLAGLELANRVRKVLEIPRFVGKVVPDQVLPTEKAAPRPRKRKAKA